MAEPYLGEIRMVGFNFAPRGYATCDGQILPIRQNEAVFSLLGTMYGGDGWTTFALPDMRGRLPIHQDYNAGLSYGQMGGEEQHSLTETEMPAHTHTLYGSSASADTENPVDNLPATGPQQYYAGEEGAVASMASDAVSHAGYGEPHNNMQPYQVINFVIALQGSYPSRN